MAETRTLDEILEGRFIRRVLSDTGHDIDTAQRKYMLAAGFDPANGWFSGRSFKTSESALEYTQQLKHRFVDMKRITQAMKPFKKKAHPIYNRIFFGHYNNIVRELKFGFTDAVKEELRQLDDN